MKRIVFFITFVIFLFAIAFVFLIANNNRMNNPTKQIPTPTEIMPTTVKPIPSDVLPTGTTAATINNVLIYIVAINDNGKSGEKIGCGDSIIGVSRVISPTVTPLQKALTELLSLKTQYYGKSGLYNALYQSQLTIEKVTLSGGKAEIKLTGTMQLGGVCDNPRVKAQLEKTAMQFPTVKSVAIFINNKPLDEVLSEK